MTVDVSPGTVVVYTDVVCAWSTVALHRQYRARVRLGLDDRLRVRLRLFPLDDVNRFAIPERMLDAEIPVVGQLARLAFFRDDRRLSMLHEVVDVARGCDLVDADPGLQMHADEDGGCPVVDSDDPSVYDDLVHRAAGGS
jgi:hypothetical protein